MVSEKVRVRLKSRRLAAELARRRGTQNGWAQRLGLSPGYLSQLVNGRRRYPGEDVRRALLEKLDLEFDDLFEVEHPGPVRPVYSVGLGRWRLRLEERLRPDLGIEERQETMESLWHDLRYALRVLRRQPLLTVVAILTLALGIGANTTIFTLVNGLFLEPVAGVDSDRAVAIFGTDEAIPGEDDALPISLPNIRDLRAQTRAFENVAATTFLPLGIADGAAEPEIEPGQMVSPSYFDVLGVEAAVGRTFRPEEEGPEGAHPVAVISHSLWQDRYAGDPDVIGREVRLNGHAFTIVGVTREGFAGQSDLFATRLWVPMAMHPQVFRLSNLVENRGWRIFFTLGRLREGVGIGAAATDLEAVGRRLAAEYPDANEGRFMRAMPLQQASIPPAQREILVQASVLLFAVVILVLAITCANVANLMLARAATRGREIAVRLSLGARRRRVVRQLFSESVLLAGAGGVLAIVVAMLGRDLLWAFRPPFVGDQIGADLSLDWRVLAFTLVVAAATAVAFGLLPALRATRGDLSRSLQQRSPGDEGSGGAGSLRSSLVVVQVALSFVAVTGAGLFLSSLTEAQRIDPGFDVERLLTTGINVEAVGYEPERGLTFYDQLERRLRASPGVESAALASNPPLVVTFLSRTTIREGDPEDAAMLIGTNAVTPGYFRTMGLRIGEGRGFEADDDASSRSVVVVNEVMARRLWPDEPALGKRVRFRGSEGLHEVVGVVEDMKYNTLGEEPQPYIYVPLAQRYAGNATLLVRSDGPPTALVDTVRSAVQELEPELPLGELAPATAALDQSLWAPRMGASLLSVFGFLSLTLAAVGIYGVLAQLVTQRRKEIGIRMALGAERADVRRLIVRQTLRWVAVGGACGLVIALVAGRWLESLLYGVSGTDPVTYALTAVVLGLAALAAASLPARRASRLDPARTLRDE